MNLSQIYHTKVLPLWLSWWRIRLQCGSPGFDPWVGKIPCRREWLHIPLFWPGQFHELYNPWGCKESNTTEWLSLNTLWLMKTSQESVICQLGNINGSMNKTFQSTERQRLLVCDVYYSYCGLVLPSLLSFSYSSPRLLWSSSQVLLPVITFPQHLCTSSRWIHMLHCS